MSKRTYEHPEVGTIIRTHRKANEKDNKRTHELQLIF